MAGRCWTRQWALALFALSAAVLGGCGNEEKAAKSGEREPERMPARQFNSNLPFRVFAEAGYAVFEWIRVVGETPSKEPLAIPSCRRWWVQPLGRPDLAAVARELDAQRIPGLQLSGPASDDDLVHLKGPKGLQTLILRDTQVTDAGLAHLKELKGLQWLSLAHTKVTDAGLAQLKDLRGLRKLDLGETRVTDAGLAHLKELTGLQTLSLYSCRKVTDAGLAHLKELKGLQSLVLMRTQVTDAGLAHLKELTGLRALWLRSCRKVTHAGIAELENSLPNVTVFLD